MRPIKKNIHWIALILVLLVLAGHSYILYSIMHYPLPVVLEESGCCVALESICAWSIILLIRKYPTTAAIVPYALLVALIFSFMVTVAEWEAIKWWVVTERTDYKIWVKHTLPIRFIILWLLQSWIATSAALQKNISVLDSRFQLKTDAATLLKEAELFKLRQQLQPHFLYNSLNSISALIMISPDKAQEMIGKLSDFLRSSVRRESEETLPVGDELGYIQSYLAIESVRFGDRLQVHIEKEYDAHATLPPFLLQPILENAIKFGLYGNTGTVTIIIHIASEAPMLNITITNPYDAHVQPPRGTGFGLDGVQRRLYLMYARTDLLETHKDGTTFTTILKIPQHV